MFEFTAIVWLSEFFGIFTLPCFVVPYCLWILFPWLVHTTVSGGLSYSNLYFAHFSIRVNIAIIMAHTNPYTRSGFPSWYCITITSYGVTTRILDRSDHLKWWMSVCFCDIIYNPSRLSLRRPTILGLALPVSNLLYTISVSKTSGMSHRLTTTGSTELYCFGNLHLPTHDSKSVTNLSATSRSLCSSEMVHSDVSICLPWAWSWTAAVDKVSWESRTKPTSVWPNLVFLPPPDSKFPLPPLLLKSWAFQKWFRVP